MELNQEAIYGMAPFARTLGIGFPQLAPDAVHAELVPQETLSTVGGGLHGGAVMSLCDVAGAVCGILNLTDGSGVATVESTTAFLRAVHGSRATAVARPVRVGRTLVNVEIDVYDDADRHCARTSQVLMAR